MTVNQTQGHHSARGGVGGENSSSTGGYDDCTSSDDSGLDDGSDSDNGGFVVSRPLTPCPLFSFHLSVQMKHIWYKL